MNNEKRDQVIAAAKACYPGSKEILNNPSVFMILDYLSEDETPLACVVSGICLRNKTRIGESGCLWETDKRLMFVGLVSAFAHQAKMLEFPYRDLKTIEVAKGGVLGFGGQKIVFELGGDRYVFMVSKSSSMIFEFVEQVNRIMRGEAPGAISASEKEEKSADISTQLEKLTHLHEQGSLSAEEFRKAKERILYS